MEQGIVEAEARAVTPQKDFDIDAYLEKRKEFITKVNAIMVEGKDYHIIQSRKSMAKGGAEKIAAIFGWTATFEKDKEAIEAFANTPGIICFVCNLQIKGEGPVIGQGRGAALLAKNGGDPNKTLKMAQKSAFIDAVIRASGLSDFYTQDLEDMNPKDIGGSTPSSQAAGNAPQRGKSEATGASKPASPAQLKYINGLMESKGVTVDALMNQGFTSYPKMTMPEAKECIDWLLKYKIPAEPTPEDEPLDEPFLD